jgi:hypothetical protein
MSNKKLTYHNTMTPIEKLINTIKLLAYIADQAIDLAQEYAGGESETAEELRQQMQEILDEHNQDN